VRDFIESWMAARQSELKTELHVPSSFCAFFAYLIPEGAIAHAVYGILGSLRFWTGLFECQCESTFRNEKK
jgi:hypothetical protein